MTKGNFTFCFKFGGADADMILGAGTPCDRVIHRNKELDGDVDIRLSEDRVEGGVPARLDCFPTITVFAGPAWIPVVESGFEVEHQKVELLGLKALLNPR